MIDNLFLGSSNSNKKKEIESIFEKNNIFIKIKTPKDFNDDSEPVEDGLSFEDNARIKAKFYYDKYGIACIAEDSGICIDYFNGYPGIHSKRFMGHLNDYDKNEYILNLMKDISNREASFHCCICYIDDKGIEHIFEGINEGEISSEQKGNEGFGYDPIFLIPKYQKTEAELGNNYKNENSHRYKAFKLLIEYLQNE